MEKMRIIRLQLILVLIGCASCKSQDNNRKLHRDIIERIISDAEEINSRTAFLDSRPSTLQQQYRGDTLFIKFNNFNVLFKPSPNQLILFPELTDSLNQQPTGLLKLGKLIGGIPIIALDSNNFETTDHNIDVELFRLKWDKLDFSNLVSFTEPIMNEYETGLIGMIVYDQQQIKQIVYRFANKGSTSFQRIQCLEFTPLGYYLEFENDRLMRIYNGQTIYNGQCERNGPNTTS